MGLHNLLSDGKSQAGPGGPSRTLIVGLIELLEDPGKLLGGDPRSGVVHPHENGVVVHWLQDKLDCSTVRRELEGIGQQIPEDLVDPIGIPDFQFGKFQDFDF